jgi:predicted ATPase
VTHVLRDFKGFAKASLSLRRPLTVLIGRNGSGKTNVIEGVELLAALAHGRPLGEIADLGRGGGAFEIRGGLEGCVRRGRASFELGFGAKRTVAGKSYVYAYSVRVAAAPTARILEEAFSIRGRSTPVFRATAAGTLLSVRHDNFSQGRNKPSFNLSSDRTVLSQYGDHVANTDKTAHARSLVQSCRSFLSASFVFDPEPHAMRNYERIGTQRLRRNGANLSSVLYGLSVGSADERRALARIAETVAQLPEEPFQSIEFVRTDLHDVILAMKVAGDVVLHDARMLSDGTLRALSVLTALETAEAGSRVVIEEFDNGLHPSRVAVLIAAVLECATRRKLHVVVTTHNPATLDALPEEHVGGVVLCAKDSQLGAATLIPLTDLPRFDVMFHGKHLGDLVTKNLLERQLQGDVEARHQAGMKAWLEALG